MSQYHKISEVDVSGGKLSLVVDGKAIVKPLKDISTTLANASSAELEQFEVSPSGYGIHWPAIDEDILIDGLLGIKHFRETVKKIA